MKNIRWLLPVLLLLTSCAGTISPIWQETAVIKNDPGGFIQRFIKKYNRWVREGKYVRVDGYCGSSCTMAIGMIPRDHLCVTPKAVWGFHGSYYNDLLIVGNKRENPEQTHLMTDHYTADINAWIASKGGLKTYKKMLYLKYPETLQYFRQCL